MSLSKLALWLYQPYKYLILIPLFIVESLFFTIWTWIFSYISGRWAGKSASAWAKVMQWITPMPVKVRGKNNIDKRQSYVIIANHQSAYDIIMIYGSLPIDFRWVMKKELRNAPIIGFACEKCGHIFLDRSSARGAWRSIQKAKEILRDGTSVVIFPEGHRSGQRDMNQFKHGAFKMAFELGLPILPVSIKDTYKVMQSGIASLRPGRATLTIHPPISPADYEGQRDELINKLRDTIASAI